MLLPLFFIAVFCSCGPSRKTSTTVSASLPGQSLPGNWRAFNDESPWNKVIDPGSKVHAMSGAIVQRMSTAAGNIRFGNYYLIPIWVVNADHMPRYKAKAAYPFDIWDHDNDFITDIGVPIDTTIWGEQTEDGHIVIVDTVYKLSWEMSRFKGIRNGMIDCSTFNVWDLSGTGVGDPNEGMRWRSRGGRAAGFPNIAGLIRPEEIVAGEIRHALAFTFSTNRKDIFYYPAARTDGRFDFEDAPAEGMLFQLNPELTDADFADWGLSPGARVVAKALQQYGMYLCDNGGDMALQLQLLDKTPAGNRNKWDSISPGLYHSITRIPTNQFRLVDTGKPIPGGSAKRVTTPLILPQCGSFGKEVEVTMFVNQHWPGAEIRYTLDGSAPGKTSLLYSNPITVRSSTTIRARAFHPDGEDSHEMSAPLVIQP